MLRSIALTVLASLSLVACLDEEESTTTSTTGAEQDDDQDSVPDECASLDDNEQGCEIPE